MESHNFYAISSATFFYIKPFLKSSNTGNKSSSVNYLFPVKLYIFPVNFENKPYFLFYFGFSSSELNKGSSSPINYFNNSSSSYVKYLSLYEIVLTFEPLLVKSNESIYFFVIFVFIITDYFGDLLSTGDFAPYYGDFAPAFYYIFILIISDLLNFYAPDFSNYSVVSLSVGVFSYSG